MSCVMAYPLRAHPGYPKAHRTTAPQVSDELVTLSLFILVFAWFGGSCWSFHFLKHTEYVKWLQSDAKLVTVPIWLLSPPAEVLGVAETTDDPKDIMDSMEGDHGFKLHLLLEGDHGFESHLPVEGECGLSPNTLMRNPSRFI